MKRISIVLAAIVVAALFSGCSLVFNTLRRVAPNRTVETVQVTMAPEEAPSEESVQTNPPAPKVSIYTSDSLGITFTLPDSWVGKYRVEERAGFLTVYFKPAEPVDPDVGDGEMFCIVKKTADIDTSFYDNAQEFEIGGVTYIWGEPTDVRYSEGQPEYDAYVQMHQDFPAIYQSIRAAQ